MRHYRKSTFAMVSPYPWKGFFARLHTRRQLSCRPAHSGAATRFMKVLHYDRSIRAAFSMPWSTDKRPGPHAMMHNAIAAHVR
jgi:hypothetical protein